MKYLTHPKRWLVAMIIVIGSLSLTGCFKDKGHHGGGEMMFEYLSWKLDLNDEQQALLADVKAEIIKAHQEMHQQRQQDKDALIALISADTLDTATAMDLFNKRQTAIAQYAPAVLEKAAALHVTLTPEQKQTIIEKINKMAAHHNK